jgi:hypothetical protein
VYETLLHIEYYLRQVFFGVIHEHTITYQSIERHKSPASFRRTTDFLVGEDVTDCHTVTTLLSHHYLSPTILLRIPTRCLRHRPESTVIYVYRAFFAFALLALARLALFVYLLYRTRRTRIHSRID